MGKSRKKIRKISIFLILFISLIISIEGLPDFQYNDINKDFNLEGGNEVEDNLKISATFALPEIHIDDNGGTTGSITWAEAKIQGICTGYGNSTHPYIIDGETRSDSDGIDGVLAITDSSVNFIIQNCILTNSENFGIRFFNVVNGSIINNECSNNGQGIKIQNSNNITIDSNTLNSNDIGIEIIQSSNIKLSNNIMTYCGLVINQATTKADMETLDIDLSNTANGKTIYYYIDKEGLSTNDFTNAGQVILVNCCDSIVSNLDISSATQGITLYYDCENITITDNIASYGDWYGMYIKDCNNITINHNTADYNADTGIYAIGDNINITNNDANNNDRGIYINSDNVNVSRNTLINNDLKGIEIDGCENTTLKDNIITRGGLYIDGSENQMNSHDIDTSNKVNGNNLYYYAKKKGLIVSDFQNAGQIILVSCNDSVIYNENIFDLYYGIVLFYCKNISVSNCDLSNNIYYGLLARYTIESNISYNTANDMNLHGFHFKDMCNDNLIIENVANNSNRGLYIDNECKHNLIKANTFSNNSYGIYIEGDSSYNNITGNFLEENSQDGLYIFYCYNLTISGNHMNTNNHYGIYLYLTTDLNITYNQVNYNNEYGLYIYLSDDVNVSLNYINYNNLRGIYIREGNNNTIKNNTIMNSYQYGIYLYKGMDHKILENSLINCGVGIEKYDSISNMDKNFIYSSNKVNGKILYYYAHQTGLTQTNFDNAGQIILLNCSYSQITSASILNSSIGVALYHSHNNTVSGVSSSHNTFFGFDLYYGNDNNLVGNTVYNNSKYGIYMSNSERNFLSGNAINNNSGDGVRITSSHFNNFSNNDIDNNGQYGIYIDYFCSYQNLTNNNIDNNGEDGIYLNGPINSFIYNNTLKDNIEFGIYLLRGTDNNILNNTMQNCGVGLYKDSTISLMNKNYINKDNSVNGKPVYYYANLDKLNPTNFSKAGQIILVNCSNSILSNVNISRCSIGIAIYHCNNTQIDLVNSSDNFFYGMDLYFSNNTEIKESIIQNNKAFGILVDSTSENSIIYLNNFIVNKIHAIDNGFNNKWDNGLLGNYWDNYTGCDNNNDGIGELNYLIPGTAGAIDHYPLTKKKCTPAISSGGDDGGDDEELPPVEIPFGNSYLLFIIIGILSLVIYIKKRKL